MKPQVTIGVVWAVLDHFESTTKKPVPTHIITQACGVDRTQLRAWARKGRLDVYDIYDKRGRLEKGYLRPKDRMKEGATIDGDGEATISGS